MCVRTENRRGNRGAHDPRLVPRVHDNVEDEILHDDENEFAVTAEGQPGLDHVRQRDCEREGLNLERERIDPLSTPAAHHCEDLRHLNDRGTDDNAVPEHPRHDELAYLHGRQRTIAHGGQQQAEDQSNQLR